MNRLAKAIALSTAVLATVAAPVAEAAAHGYYYHGYRGPGHRYYRHHDRGSAVAAGVIGLAAGAIIGSALSRPPQPRVIYQAPPPAPYYPPAPRPYPVYGGPAYGGFEPWSPGWYDYCSRQFRSFNPRTGTFRGYDGRNHFCNAP